MGPFYKYKSHVTVQKSNPFAFRASIMLLMKIKYSLFFALLWIQSSTVLAQTPTVNPDVFFAQGIFAIPANEIAQAELFVRSNPNVQVVRLDAYSNRFFILTKHMSAFTEADLRSWLGAYGDELTCIQIGIHGVDPVAPFPFTSCNEE